MRSHRTGMKGNCLKSDRRPGRLLRWLAAAALVLPVVASLTGHALANDSVAHLAAGGLVLGRTDAIEMRKEDLYVSAAQIRVRYEFFNRTSEDVTTLVAFPLPDLTAPSDEESFVIPVDAPADFLGFKVLVDDTPVKVRVEQRAVALGIDRTDLLRELSVPLAPHMEATGKLLDTMGRDELLKLEELGMIAWEEYDIGNGMERHALPLWSLKTTYYWPQVFRAKTPVIVEHTYTPSVGASVQTPLGSDAADAVTLADYSRRYCTDPGFLTAVERVQRSGQAVFSEKWVEYILTTGANWAGPIGEFRLVVDKGAPGNLVSFCGEGVNKISPTQFEMRKTDYWPQRNLEVLILERYQVEQ